jgi:hypothetical protein
MVSTKGSKKRIAYAEYAHLRVGDKIKVRGYVRTVRFIRGYRVAYEIKKDLSSAHWTEIQEVLDRDEHTS